ncbi:MAG: Lrp/AsnC family transcriptional regulator [Crocinitomicaceae bacterium]|nr:Lrp/AsnC family transcriptional regulator [Crocinitomicaceae bacterium]
MKLDTTDQKIIELLQTDAKMSIQSMAEELNITKTPIYERIKRLEKGKVIQKYIAVIDELKLKGGMYVFCSVSLESQQLEHIEKFKQEIEKIPEVMECYLMGGANDFFMKVHVQDLNAYHQFSSGKLASLPNVSQIKSSFVLDTVKKSL